MEKMLKQLKQQIEGFVREIGEMKGDMPSETKILEKVESMVERAVLKASAAAPGTTAASRDANKKLNEQMHFCMSPRTATEERAKALNVAVGADGGYLAPEEFIAEVDRKLVQLSPMRGLATVISGVGLKGAMPKEDSSITFVWGDENAAPSNTQPGFKQLVWSLNKATAITFMSREITENAEVDLVGLLSDMYSEQYALHENAAFTTGSGSGRPLGWRNASGLGTVAQAGGSLDYDDVVNLFFEVPAQYRNRPGVAWMAHSDVLEILAKTKDSNGLPIFLQDWVIGGKQNTSFQGEANSHLVGKIFNRPVMENPDLTNTELGFGGWKKYKIFEQGGLLMESTDIGGGAFEKHQVATKAVKHVDGKLSIVDGIKVLTGVS